jgi:aldose 1-epimerase
VTWQLDIDRQPVYPWRIHLEITYLISDFRLEVLTHVRNDDSRRAPFGIGFHSDFVTGPESVDGVVLEMPATTHLIVDERMLPRSVEPIAESAFSSLSQPGGLSLRGISLDDCFSGLGRDENGVAEIRYFPGDTLPRLLIRCGPAFTHVTCFTADTRPEPLRRQSMSIEPMTCPANALRTGDGIATIEPRGTFSSWFSVELAG